MNVGMIITEKHKETRERERERESKQNTLNSINERSNNPKITVTNL